MEQIVFIGIATNVKYALSWIVSELYRALTWQWIERTTFNVISANGDIVTACDLTTANWKRCGESAKRMMEILLATPNWE